MKVTIKEWNAVASWRWDMPEDDVCGICRVQFDGTCPTCKYPGDDCALCMFGHHILVGSIGLNESFSDWHLRPFLPHGISLLPNNLLWHVLILHSIAFSRGLTKIHLRDYVRCAGKVRRPSSFKDFNGS